MNGLIQKVGSNVDYWQNYSMKKVVKFIQPCTSNIHYQENVLYFYYVVRDSREGYWW